jgi:signal transduction histidine kinase
VSPEAELRARPVPRVAALLAAGALIEVVVRLGLTPVTTRNPLGALGLCSLSALAAAALILPGPQTATAVILLTSLLSLVAFHSLTVSGLIAGVLAGYRAGRLGSPLALTLCVPFLLAALLGPRPGSSETAALTLLTAVLPPAGALIGVQRRLRAQAERSTLRDHDFEERLLAHTVRAERARIARELHDIVAHHISMVSVQAETARVTTPGMPEAGARRLAAIGDTARTALTEMRRLLGVLKDDSWPDADAMPLQPQPGLDQINALIDEAREASGSATRLILSGRPARLDPGVELAAYRIVQEALTNARRHAPGAAVDVELGYGADAVTLRVRDNGPGQIAAVDRSGENGGAGASAGHGLAGMRERATAVGGVLVSGPVPGGGFSVEASLPATPEATR